MKKILWYLLVIPAAIIIILNYTFGQLLYAIGEGLNEVNRKTANIDDKLHLFMYKLKTKQKEKSHAQYK